MPTINQLIRKPRQDKEVRNTVPALQGNPQKRGGVYTCDDNNAEETKLGAA